MPRYEFLCRKCDKPFELIYSLEEYDTVESENVGRARHNENTARQKYNTRREAMTGSC